MDLSFGNSYEFTNTNVYGTHVLLECAKNCGTLKRFIHVSTDEVYGEVAEDGDDCKEGAILAPTNPYAASKAAAEMLVHSYWKSFKLPIIIVRSNNIYGPHQFPESTSPPPPVAPLHSPTLLTSTRNNPQIHPPPLPTAPTIHPRRRPTHTTVPLRLRLLRRLRHDPPPGSNRQHLQRRLHRRDLESTPLHYAAFAFWP